MKTLKVLLLVIFCNILSYSAISQSNTCKFEINKTDPATNTPIQKIKTKLTGTDVFYIYISRTDTTYIFT
ncbi:MAG TPA: hypothetical protein PKN41_02630, partial [Bacteroidales bacterium]|nr:hypothetical protein [Bacteroidales bacterium]